MPLAEEVTDPSDWLPTSLSLFAPIDSALRCQVCKEFYNTPMITSCSHTFCSLCIRRCLSTDGKCPACRQTDQPSKLRVNGTVQELVEAFTAARSQGLELALKATSPSLELALKAEQEVEDEVEGQPRRKRRKVGRQEIDAPPARQTRQTRSSGRRTNAIATSQNTMVLDSEDDHVEEYPPEPEPKELDDGLVACPMCETRMKEASVYAHLDRCDGKVAPKSRRPKTPPLKPPSKAIVIPASPAKHLPHLNYSLLKDNPLKKKLQELGIPAWGTRQLLIRRHTQWVDIFNANSDSPRPRPNRELLKDLDTWERTQGGNAPGQGQTGPQGVMKKDFDGEAWTRRHKEGSKGYAGFDELIASARAKVKSAKTKAEEHAAEKTASGRRPSEISPLEAPFLLPSPITTELSDMEQMKAEQEAIAAQTTPVTSTSKVEPISGAATFFQHAAEDIPMRDPTPSPDFNPPPSSQNERRTAHQERRFSNPKEPTSSQNGRRHSIPRPAFSSQPQNPHRYSQHQHTPAEAPPIPNAQKEDSLGNKVASLSGEQSLGSTEPARRIPMFRVPEEPVKDNEGGLVPLLDEDNSLSC
ncbi:DNA repair protein rad18 [Venturia nashicola]|uniref:Postreplication repair E3 ubiquitin-protein ligase RAD18 n=1 Tax=Venturia nashicola TaxID=86259 RepID=A0A4Z1PP61_9PEZI|nr:DNA repair protein rad18 [Venturia nashicola]